MNGRLCCRVFCLLVPVLSRAAEDPARQHPPGGYDPGIELPPGEGKAIMEEACTKCHDLAGLQAYQGYWNEALWRSMVETMVENGAELDETQITIVTDYLTRHFGPGTRD